MLPAVLAVVAVVVGVTTWLLVGRSPGGSPGASDTTTSATAEAAATTAATTTAATSTAAATTSVPPPTVPAATSAAAGEPVGADLQGVWSGEGTLATCTGFSNSCEATVPLDVTVDCPTTQCTLLIGDGTYRPGPLYLEGALHRANGPVPFGSSPTCEGMTVIATWSVGFSVEGDRMVGTYSESSRTTFDCGATEQTWDFTLTRG